MESKQPTDKEVVQKCIAAMLGKVDARDLYDTVGHISDNTILTILKQSHNLEDLKEYWTRAGTVGVVHEAPLVLERISDNRDLWGVGSFLNREVVIDTSRLLVSNVIKNIVLICGRSSKRVKKFEKHHPDFLRDLFVTLCKCHEHYGCCYEVQYLLETMEVILLARSDPFAEEIHGLTKQDLCKIVNMIPLKPEASIEDTFDGLLCVFCILCHETGRKLDDVSWGAQLLLKCENWLHDSIDEAVQERVMTAIAVLKGYLVSAVDLERGRVTVFTQAKRTRRARRRCNASGCSKKGSKTCSGCYAVYYCSAACQRSNWKLHKKVCKVSKW